MLNQLFAHAAERHDEATSSLEHSVTEPVGFVLVAVGGIGLIILLGRIFHWSYGTITLILLGFLLTAGIFGYTYLPALGALFIAVGITLALGFVLLGLVNERDNL